VVLGAAVTPSPMDANAKGVAVFSGECLEAVCGISVGANDLRGVPLFTGDIVIVFTVDERDTEHGPTVDYFPDGLTAVVSDEWTTYQGGEYVRKEGVPEFFVMGIRSRPLNDAGEWRVMKVKGHDEVLVGERWSAYGFNYREVPPSVQAHLAACEPQP
jgi:hypothetical protein